MPSPSPNGFISLRRPALVYGPVAVILIFVVALVCASLINTGFSAYAPVAARGLFTPALIGLGLTIASLGPRVRRREIAARGQLIRRTAISFAIAGFVWPLSFGIAVALQGDGASFISSLLPAMLGIFVGGVCGAAAGAAAAYVCFTRA